MKKILFILSFPFLLLATVDKANAQANPSTVTPFKSVTYGNLSDTVTDGGTQYLKIVGGIKGKIPDLTAVATVTKITGTAGGTVSLQASVDSVNWYNAITLTADSIWTPANVSSQSYRWKLSNWRDLHLRLRYKGVGTMQVSVTGNVFY